MSIERILKGKSAEIVTIAETASLTEVCTLLARYRIGAVPVTEGERLIGIVSERDIVRLLAAHGAAALGIPVGQAMTRAVRTITRATTIEEAMAIMTEGRFRHLPLLEGGRLVGIVSIGDIVKIRLMDQQREVEDLRSYVGGAS